LSYLKQLSKTYHDNIPIDKKAFIAFLMELLKEFNLINAADLTAEQEIDIQKGLEQKLYGK